MSGVIFVETLRRNWRQVLYWGGALALLGLYILVIIPDVDTLKQYADLVASMPPVLLQMFGADDVTAVATPEGFVNFGYFGYSLLILAVLAILNGLAVTANEEDQGVLDVVMSLPLPRWRLVLEKLAAYALLLVLVILLGFVGLVIGSQTSALSVETGKLLQSSLNMIPSVLLMLTFTALAGTVFRRKGGATAAAAIFVIGSYFIDFLGGAASGTLADQLRAVSFFSYYDSQGVMFDGLNAGNIALLLGVTLALAAGSLWFFRRRDIGI